jgi:hypothetical protein
MSEPNLKKQTQFRNAEMSVNILKQKVYEDRWQRRSVKNKANSKPTHISCRG